MDIKKSVKDTIENTKDATKEALHRSTADAEHARRDIDGGDMTATDKLKSVGNEVKNRTEAEIDKAKREVRTHT
jgi:hypothetical protein